MSSCYTLIICFALGCSSTESIVNLGQQDILKHVVTYETSQGSIVALYYINDVGEGFGKVSVEAFINGSHSGTWAKYVPSGVCSYAKIGEEPKESNCKGIDAHIAVLAQVLSQQQEQAQRSRRLETIGL